jgi:fatty-acyl-CoA synthase
VNNLPDVVVTDQPLPTPIVRRGIESPDGVFGVFHESGRWQSLTHEAFLDRALRFASLFRQKGVERGGVILIILRHGIDAHAAFVGAMLEGAVPSFLPYPNVKQDRELYWHQHATIFAYCRPSLILVYDELSDAVAECAQGTAAMVVALSAVRDHVPVHADRLPRAADVALLQYSSGTTGLKKGVALSYRSICKQLQAYGSALGLQTDAEARVVSWLPLYHDMGLISSFLLPMWLGLPIISLDPFVWLTQTWLFFEGIQDHRATHAWMPNFAFMHLVRTIRGSRTWDLGSLVALVSCSEPCKAEAFDAFVARFGPWGVKPEMLQTCYAMAETVFAVSQSGLGQPVRRLAVDRCCIADLSPIVPPRAAGDAQLLLSNGPPVVGCEIRILRNRTFLSERQIGEICVASSYLFDGYYKNPEATKDAMHDGWYRTGDLGFLDGGELFIVGRIKDVIIINGKNVVAHDLEAAVSRVPGVKPGRCVAFGHYAAALGSEQLIIVAESNDHEGDAAAVMRDINRAVLREVGIPCADVRLVDLGWLIKTTSGKISRSENVRKYGEQFGLSDRFAR